MKQKPKTSVLFNFLTGCRAVVFVLFFLLLYAAQTHAAGTDARHSNEHPHLLLTSDNLAEYRQKSKGENQSLFEQARLLAEELCHRPLVSFPNAHNRYREVGDALPVLGLMYQINGNRNYVETAKKWIHAMLETKSWEGSQNLGRSSWMVGLCFLYDWMYDVLDEGLKERLVSRLIKEAEIVKETASDTRALSNHLLIETSAVGLVGLLLPESHPQKQSFLSTADRWTQYIIQHAPTDGAWGEGVQYWQYGTGYFVRFLEAARTAGFKNYYPEYNWLRKMGYFPIYFSLPGNLTKVINFSDCGTNRYLPAFLFYLPARVYQNGYFQDFGKKVQSAEPHKFSWLDFLFYDAAVPAKDFTSLPLFHHFSDQGFVSMRTGWEQGATVVGFRCGPAPGHKNQSDPERVQHRGFGPGHQQPDINSFVLFAKNEWLAIDPGYTHKKETGIHNTLLVNGYGQAGAGGDWLDYMAFESRIPAPEITYAESNSDIDYVIGDAGNIYVDEAGVEYFRRHLVFLKPDIVIVLDDVKARKESTVDWLLQMNEIAHVQRLKADFKVRKNQAAFRVHPVLPHTVSTSLEQRKVEASDVHGLPGRNSGMLKTLRLSNQSQSVRFLVVITIEENNNEQAPEVQFENNILEVENNGRKWKLKYIAESASPDRPLLELVR